MTTQQKIEEIEEIELGGFYPDMDAIASKLNEIIAVVNSLAPVLPEDEECEVVEVVRAYKDNVVCAGYDGMVFTKTDGKKLKIKVVKKNENTKGN